MTAKTGANLSHLHFGAIDLLLCRRALCLENLFRLESCIVVGMPRKKERKRDNVIQHEREIECTDSDFLSCYDTILSYIDYISKYINRWINCDGYAEQLRPFELLFWIGYADLSTPIKLC